MIYALFAFFHAQLPETNPKYKIRVTPEQWASLARVLVNIKQHSEHNDAVRAFVALLEDRHLYFVDAAAGLSVMGRASKPNPAQLREIAGPVLASRLTRDLSAATEAYEAARSSLPEFPWSVWHY